MYFSISVCSMIWLSVGFSVIGGTGDWDRVEMRVAAVLISKLVDWGTLSSAVFGVVVAAAGGAGAEGEAGLSFGVGAGLVGGS